MALVMKSTTTACSFLCLLLLLGCCANTHNIKRTDDDMQVEDMEFPFPAVNDLVAGAPGSQSIDHHQGSGFAHQTANGDASAPCDMTGSTVDMSPDEQPVTKPKEHIPKPIIIAEFPPDADLSEHACLVTTRIVNLDPPIEDRFSIYSAVFEGNDRRGEASASDYQITECGCMCSGLNVVCGEPGSISYYSDVTTPVDCAQLMCHPNQFRQCFWNGTLITTGIWVGDAVRFNSTVLPKLPGDTTPEFVPTTTDNSTNVKNQTITDVTTNENNSTIAPSPPPFLPPKNFTNSSSTPSQSTHFPVEDTSVGLLDNFPSPSPSPSYVPTYQDRVNERALKLVVTLAEKACVRLDHQMLVIIGTEIKSLNMSLPPKVTCPVLKEELTSTSVESVKMEMDESDFIGDALAGFDGSSPIAADATRDTTFSMNDNTNAPDTFLLLLDLQDDILVDAYFKVVRLFQNSIKEEIQCAPGVPCMSKLLMDALDVTRNCTRQMKRYNLFLQQFEMDTLVTEILTSTLTTIFQNIEVVLGIKGPKRPPTPLPVPTVPAEAIAEDPNPPFLPPLAPAPTELTNQPNPTAVVMEGNAGPECGGHEATLQNAHSEIPSDFNPTHKPGARFPHQLPNVGKAELPLFGRQKLEWGSRNPDVVVLEKPVQLESQ